MIQGPPPLALDPRTTVSGANQKARLEQAAKSLEAVFMNQLLGQMRQASQALSGEASSEMSTVQGLFDQQLAQSMAQSGGIGLADMLVRQLSRGGLQEPAPTESSQVSAKAADNRP